MSSGHSVQSPLDVSTTPCPRAVYGEDARCAFDPDIYDCARCGHMIGDHCGPSGECAICAEMPRD